MAARGAHLELVALSKCFGGVVAVDGISLDVPAGGFVSLLGPSGSGKTTTLNLIAGFLSPDAGDICFDGASVLEVPPHRRNIGMVFQSYSLFPHMTVRDNVGYPLRMRTRLGRAAADVRVKEMLDLVRLAELGSRYPRQLSGGQQQRVAMARALVSEPRLLLMDEPLGALDKKLREQLQSEIKRIHRSVGTTVVYVTHDQTEALAMSDLVVVMERGRIAQIGRPRELYEAPASVFVADFLGQSNLLAAKVRGAAGDALEVELAAGPVVTAPRGAVPAAPGARVVVLIRPEALTVTPGTAPTEEWALAGRVTDIAYHGDTLRLDVAVGSEQLSAKIPSGNNDGIAIGGRVSVSWPADAARVLPLEGDAE